METVKQRIDDVAWIDTENNFHFDMIAFLKKAGMDDTPENHALVAAELEALIHKASPKTIVIKRPPPPQ